MEQKSTLNFKTIKAVCEITQHTQGKTSLFHRDLKHLEQTVNQELVKINTWLCANKL